MTRYSASRGIHYTAPPGPDGERRDAGDEDVEEPSATEVEGDGGRADERGSDPADERGSNHAAADD